MLKSCDVFSDTPISSIRQMIGYESNNISSRPDGMTIYVCGSAVPHFLKIYKTIPNRFILVSGDCDETIPNDIFTSQAEFLDFMNDKKLIHWFSQNCVLTNHPKLTQMPIGLDYHTLSGGSHSWGPQATPIYQELTLNRIRDNAQPFWEREIKAYASFHLFVNTKYGYDRIDAINKIPEESVYYEPTKVQRNESWQNQSKYAFVISPHGNGLDCHRTWEALVLGCIPIVKRSPLDKLYDELPVLIVDAWTDATLEKMAETVSEFKEKTFNYNKLSLNYWVSKINSYRP